MLEEERKYDVGVGFALPDLTGCLPGDGKVVPCPPVTLRATYYDTDDLRLARAGVSLRHRSGEAGDKPWTVKLPAGAAGSRDEISRPGIARSVPDELTALLTVYHRGAPLRPAATIRTLRRAYELRDRRGTLLAEVADDTVSVLMGRQVVDQFREIEVERRDGDAALLDAVDATLCAAGAEFGRFVPKHVRALGNRASAPPDLPAPPAPPPVGAATAGAAVIAVLRRDITRIVNADPYVRLRAALPNGDTPVHQMRVGCRRLRSDLRTFAPLIDEEWAAGLRAETGWLAGILGKARDAEVLRARLWRTADADPLAPPDATALATIDAELAARHDEALRALDAALADKRYLRLVEALVDAAREPKLTAAGSQPAAAVLPGLVARPWGELVDGARDGVGAGELDQKGPDADWHAVRIRGKRARYAAEAVAAVLGGEANELAKALAEVQELLGEHQDAAVAGEAWLSAASAHPHDHTLAVTAGRLFERERAAIRRVRKRFPTVWRAANKRRHTRWLTA